LSTLKIPTARIFSPLLKPSRYKGIFGGRGSGKSHFFGELLVETCQAERGTSAVCIREAQRTLAQSSKRLIESKIATLGVGSHFRIFSDKIETPGDGIIIFRGMHHGALHGHGSVREIGRCQGRSAQGCAVTMWVKLRALSLNSLTIAWSYVLASTGAVLQAIDASADALGDPTLKDNISAAIGDAKTVGRIIMAISVVTIIARLRSIKKAS
jgi:hypothetical protein